MGWGEKDQMKFLPGKKKERLWQVPNKGKMQLHRFEGGFNGEDERDTSAKRGVERD